MGQTSASRAKQSAPFSAEKSRHRSYAVCDSCDEKKRLTEFHKNGTGQKYEANDPRRYRPTCNRCLAPTNSSVADPAFQPDRKGPPKRTRRTRIEKNKYAAAGKRKIRRSTRIACLKYLSAQGCAECGQRDPRVLEFDHLDPSKKDQNIATLISGGYAWSSEVLRREIRKCRILCANCHRKHTIGQQDYYSHSDVRAALRAIYEDYDIAE